MKIITIATLLVATPAFANDQIQTETLCFNSFDKNNIKLEFRTFYDPKSKWQGGYVKYSTSNKVIPITPSHSESTSNSQSTPDTTTTTWIELNKDSISGKYEISAQGGVPSSFTYVNLKSKKTYSFVLDPNIDHSIESGCKW